MIDANANRAREGLRVLEDAARFALDDASLTRRCKHARHALGEALVALGLSTDELLASRDADADVGADVRTAGEGHRPTMGSVAAAAAGRSAEALRSLEECAKALGQGTVAAGLGHLRYEVYEVHRAVGPLLARLEASAGTVGVRQPRLCVLVSESLCQRADWKRVVEGSLAGGADAIQLREKQLNDRELLARARWVVQACKHASALSVINDRADVALMAGAAMVHVGQTDLPVRELRRLVGPRLAIGISTENVEQALAGVAMGADLCGVGPMFPTSTKDKPRLAGPPALHAYLAHPVLGRVPHLAIGGINTANAAELARVAAGVRAQLGVAVSSVVCGANDPRGVCESLRKAIDGARAGA